MDSRSIFEAWLANVVDRPVQTENTPSHCIAPGSQSCEPAQPAINAVIGLEK
jgi:hypothetical protein